MKRKTGEVRIVLEKGENTRTGTSVEMIIFC
jgi:hypothetical protein